MTLIKKIVLITNLILNKNNIDYYKIIKTNSKGEISMDNNLRKLERELRAIAKRCKDVRYTRDLLLCFLFMGLLSFSSGVTSQGVKDTQNSINQARKELNTSIGDIKTLFKQSRRENNKLMKNANLELIKLMEEGDHIVKSPWSSWQFGTAYSYNGWREAYKGRGDRKKLYAYEGILSQGEWWQNMANRKGELFKNLSKQHNEYSSLDTDRMNAGLNSYGLLDLGLLSEPVVSLKVGGGITTKSVERENAIVNAPGNVSMSAPALPALNVPRLQYGIQDPVLALPSKVKPFNIDLGSYCNDMETCGYDDPRLKEAIEYSKDPSNTWNHNFPNFDFTGGINDVDYAGYRYLGDTSTGFASFIGDTTDTNSFLASIRAHDPSANFNPTLRYSWNISDKRARGQWRLFRIYFDVQSQFVSPGNYTPSHLTINTSLKISSINDVVPAGDETSRNRDFNEQTNKFLVGGSRIATLDNAKEGGSIKNTSNMSLIGPLTVGLEVQYDQEGDKERLLENNGSINDNEEPADAGLNSKLARGASHILDLGIHDWKTWEEVATDDGATLPIDSRFLNFSGEAVADSTRSRHSLSSPTEEIKRNLRGYTGAKVGMMLTREDGEYAGIMRNPNPGSVPGGQNPYFVDDGYISVRKDEDAYRLVNGGSGVIEFHGDKSIGIQIYSPYAGDFGSSQSEDDWLVYGNWKYFYDESIPPYVTVINEGTIKTDGTESHGIKVSSGIDINKSKIENTGRIKVSGFKEDLSMTAIPGLASGYVRKGLPTDLDPDRSRGESSGMTVLEDTTQDGQVDYKIARNRGDTNFTGSPTIASPTPKPIRVGDKVKNKGTIEVSGIGNSGMFLKTTFNDTLTNETGATIELVDSDIENAAYNSGLAENAHNPQRFRYNTNNIGMRIETGTVTDKDWRASSNFNNANNRQRV